MMTQLGRGTPDGIGTSRSNGSLISCFVRLCGRRFGIEGSKESYMDNKKKVWEGEKWAFLFFG